MQTGKALYAYKLRYAQESKSNCQVLTVDSLIRGTRM